MATSKNLMSGKIPIVALVGLIACGIAFVQYSDDTGLASDFLPRMEKNHAYKAGFYGEAQTALTAEGLHANAIYRGTIELLSKWQSGCPKISGTPSEPAWRSTCNPFHSMKMLDDQDAELREESCYVCRCAPCCGSRAESSRGPGCP